MAVELGYTPLTDPDQVTTKLRDALTPAVPNINDQQLLEGVVDAIASSGDEDWTTVDETHFQPTEGVKLMIGCYYEDHVEPIGWNAWMNLMNDGSPEKDEGYSVRKPDDLEPQLYSTNLRTNEVTPVPQTDTATRIRLMQLLLDGCMYTPVEDRIPS